MPVANPLNAAVYGPFTDGVNNRLSDEQLGPTMLRQAVNCALSNTGHLSLRDGYTLVKARSNAHSLHADSSGVYYVDGETLYSYNPATGTESALRTGMTLDAPMAAINVNGDVYWSNGHQRGKIVAGVLKDWGVEIPSGIPTVATSGAGMLDAGRREVLCTFVNSLGEESGAGLSAGVTLTGSAGVLVSNLPQPTSAEIVSINVYMTPANGGVFYRAASVAVGVTSVSVTSLAPSIELATQFLTPPMPGTVLAYVAGRMYIASGNIVWYTEPFTYGRIRPSRNFMMFPAPVTLMAGVQDGLYIAADKTYFLSGTDPNAAALTVVLPYGAAFGSLAPIPIMPNTWTWRGDRDQVMASNGGQVKNLQQDDLALAPCSTGASLFYEIDGGQQILATGVPKPEFYAEASDFITMEVRRKGA